MFLLIFGEKRPDCSCDEVVSFGKSLLRFSALGVSPSHKFVEVYPVRSIPDIFLQHQGHHFFQIFFVNVPKSAKVRLYFGPVYFRAVIQVALILPLE